MYVITGALGQTGKAAVESLLHAGARVRAIVRREDPVLDGWRARGVQVATADLLDTVALTQAMQGAHGAYLMNPPAYMVPDLFAHARRTHASLLAAATAANVPHVVALSSIGAQHAQGTGNILTTHDFEEQLARHLGAVTVLRAPNFMENFAWSLEPVVRSGVLPTMFEPIDRKLPMASAVDVGRAAARLLLAPAEGWRRVELHGPADYSAQDAANVLARLLVKPVRCEVVPRPAWAEIFRGIGFPPATVAGFCEMYEGFNGGLMRFEGDPVERGAIDLEQALAPLVNPARGGEHAA